MNILIPVSPGELIDKLTILEIKLELINDESKRANVAHEHGLLTSAYRAAVTETEALKTLSAALKKVNRELWDLEDDIRAEERRRTFGERFVELARSVYRTNDRRGGSQAPSQHSAGKPHPRGEELR